MEKVPCRKERRCWNKPDSEGGGDGTEDPEGLLGVQGGR